MVLRQGMIQQIVSAIPTGHFYLVELANGARYRHRVASRLESLHLVLEQVEKSVAYDERYKFDEDLGMKCLIGMNSLRR